VQSDSDSPSEKNRGYWNRDSGAYQQMHGQGLEERALAWGVWRIPESELRVLGEVAGRDVLELGCGGAQWSAALAARGARAVGMDLSERQLAHAAGRLRALGARVPLVQGDAERAPFASASFDVVFCDHGAMSFARPEPAVAEAARLLRPGGVFAFCMASLLHDLCADPVTQRVEPRLELAAFEPLVLDDGQSVCHQLLHGEWIRVFRRHRFVVEDLIELRPPPGATTTYADFVPLEWARRWPAENVWKLRRA
jgi:SAM-dependent methyltransferase